MVGRGILRFLIGSTKFLSFGATSRETATCDRTREFASGRFSRIRHARLAFLSVISHLKNVPGKEKYVCAFNLSCQRTAAGKFLGDYLRNSEIAKRYILFLAFGKLMRFKGLSFAELNRPNCSS